MGKRFSEGEVPSEVAEIADSTAPKSKAELRAERRKGLEDSLALAGKLEIDPAELEDKTKKEVDARIAQRVARNHARMSDLLEEFKDIEPALSKDEITLPIEAKKPEGETYAKEIEGLWRIVRSSNRFSDTDRLKAIKSLIGTYIIEARGITTNGVTQVVSPERQTDLESKIKELAAYRELYEERVQQRSDEMEGSQIIATQNLRGLVGDLKKGTRQNLGEKRPDNSEVLEKARQELLVLDGLIDGCASRQDIDQLDISLKDWRTKHQGVFDNDPGLQAAFTEARNHLYTKNLEISDRSTESAEQREIRQMAEAAWDSVIDPELTKKEGIDPGEISKRRSAFVERMIKDNQS